MLLFVVVVHVQAFLNCPGTKNWSKYSPTRTECPLKRKHLGGKCGKSHPTQPNHQFSGDMLVFRVLYFLGWGWETHQNLPKTGLGILTATVVGVACQWPPPVRAASVGDLKVLDAMHQNNTPPKFNMEPEKKSLEKEAPLGNHHDFRFHVKFRGST